MVKRLFIKFKDWLLCPLSRKEKEVLENWEWYLISKDVRNYYRCNVKNNYNDSLETIKKKLIRNILLGKVISKLGTYITVEYGNLLIEYSYATNTIISVKNRKGKYPLKIRNRKKQYIEKYLELI